MVPLEAVTVCVNYSDFLAEVAPYNLPHFSRWLVVTTPGDEATREVCRQFGMECLLCEEAGQPFNKGRLIERGLHHVSIDGWRLHIDADIALPLHFSQSLRSARLQTDRIYGCDRVNVKSFADWQRFKAGGYLSGRQRHLHWGLFWPQSATPGARYASHHAGYVPIGFFQLWHSDSDSWRGSRCRPYPEHHSNAARTDTQFGMLWDREKRELLPEFIAVHLESEPAHMGRNWNGRKTKRFGEAGGY